MEVFLHYIFIYKIQRYNMKMKIYHQIWIILILCFLLIFSILQFLPKSDSSEATIIFQTDKGNFEFFCMVADNIQEQRTGLLGMTTLEQDHGMLFSFDSCQNRTFTMEDMNFPLDIIFINETMIVIHIIEAEIDQNDITSNGPTQFVVEINKGIAEQNNIRIGTSIEIIFHKE